MTETGPLHVVLYQPAIPQNVGAIGRTCVAVGAKLWLVRPLGFHTDAHSLRRAGLDYWQHLQWEAVDDWPALVRRLSGCRFWMLTKSARRLYTDVGYEPGDVLVFGSETQGLPRRLLDEHAACQLRIPTSGRVRCLNLASSVAVVVYEALRQWRAAGMLPLDQTTDPSATEPPQEP